MEVNQTNVNSTKYIQNFEQFLTMHDIQKFAVDKKHFVLYACLFYFLLIYCGKRFMENRKPYKLQGALVIWNLFLAITSTITVFRQFPHLSHLLQHYGVYSAICLRYVNNTTPFYTMIFIGFKIVEFGDTLFLILRKKELIFLHWYHHATVLLYCWHCIMQLTPTATIFAVVNSTLHSVMYSYYSFRAMNIQIPNFISVSITLLQITQMMIGCLVNILSYWYIRNDNVCYVPTSNILFSSALYFSYLILFLNYFYCTYFQKNKKKIQ